MKRVLVTHPILVNKIDHYEARLKQEGVEVVCHPVVQGATEKELLSLVLEFDGFLCGDDSFTRQVLCAASKRLKVISKCGVGIDTIDQDAAHEFGIKVYNTPGVYGEAVAEVAMGYMLLLSRRLHQIDSEVRRGKWPKYEAEGLAGKVLGIVGCGSIGRALNQCASGFSMVVLGTDSDLSKAREIDGLSCVKFDSLLEKSDFVCLSCNLTSENRKMIGYRQFQAMKRTSFLINVARGALIDEEALIESLRDGSISGAALDVYETEPLSPNHPLAAMSNVVLGSHNANNVKKANEAVYDMAVCNLLSGLGNSSSL